MLYTQRVANEVTLQRSVGGRAYAQLREDVWDGVLKPGAVLAEVEQSARLGVSRTPVREAFARLVADGLAQPLAGRGLVVAPLSADGVTHLYEVREALEVQAVRLAARRCVPVDFEQLAADFAAAPGLVGAGEEGLRAYYELATDFDAAIDAAVGNPHLVAAMRQVRTHLVRVRRFARHAPQRLVAAADEHALVAEAIAAGDADLAAHAMHVHLHRSREHFLTAVREAGPSGPPVAGRSARPPAVGRGRSLSRPGATS